jgi:hypothetical protein
MVLFVTNRTYAALVMINGLDGTLSKPCTVFHYTTELANEVDLSFVAVEFYPRRANASTETINIGWVTTMNYSLILKHWRHAASVRSDAAQRYYYEFRSTAAS